MFKVTQTSIKELEERLIQEKNNVKKRYQLGGRPNHQLNENDLYQIIKAACDIIIIDYSDEQDLTNYSYGIYNPSTRTYVRERNYLGYLIQHIINSETLSPNISSKKAISKVDEAIKFSKNKLTKANQPPQHIVKFKNCVYDLKHKRRYEFDDEEVKDYHFLNMIRYPYKELDEVNEEMLEIVDRVMNSWTNGNEDIEKTLNQIIFSAIEGNGRNVQIILKSDGGDGKSTFLRTLQKIGHTSLTHHLNIDEYGDDNALNQIQPSTKLILGDDLASNFKVTHKILSRLKTLVDGGILNVSEKYMPNKLIQSSALKIQATNTDVKFYENNDAIRDRILLIIWPHHNFRQNPITDFNLDILTGKRGKADEDFMTAYIARAIHKTEYFDHFHVTQAMKDDMQEMLDDNDMLSQFMIELDDLDVLSYSHIPSFVVYEHYKQWLNNINPGSKPMKMIDFTRKLRKQLLNYGYDDSSRLLLSQIENNQFNFDIFEDMYIDFQKKTTVFINHDLTIEGKQEQLEKDAQELSAEVFQSKYDRKQINAYLHYLNDVNGQKLLSLFLDSNTDYTPDQIHDIPNDELVRIVQSQ